MTEAFMLGLEIYLLIGIITVQVSWDNFVNSGGLGDRQNSFMLRKTIVIVKLVSIIIWMPLAVAMLKDLLKDRKRND